MAKPLFVVPVADLERGVKAVSWPIPVAWLESTFEGTDAVPRGDPGVLEVELSKSGSDVLVRGHASVHITMHCVVTLEPLPFELRPEIFLLLGKAPSAPPTATRAGRGPKRKVALPGKAEKVGKTGPAAGPGGSARSGRGRGKSGEIWGQDAELSEKDAGRDVFEGDKVVLDEFLREFILLEVPMYPRRSDLPPEQTPARATPPSTEASVSPSVDPRLLPLAELRERLRKNQKE